MEYFKNKKEIKWNKIFQMHKFTYKYLKPVTNSNSFLKKSIDQCFSSIPNPPVRFLSARMPMAANDDLIPSHCHAGYFTLDDKHSVLSLRRECVLVDCFL